MKFLTPRLPVPCTNQDPILPSRTVTEATRMTASVQSRLSQSLSQEWRASECGWWNPCRSGSGVSGGHCTVGVVLMGLYALLYLLICAVCLDSPWDFSLATSVARAFAVKLSPYSHRILLSRSNELCGRGNHIQHFRLQA